jgi:NTE family protein
MNCQFLLCIATDIETGKEVLLNKSLAEAMMASPHFLYFPGRNRGRLLVDGGVTNNYPIDEVSLV